MRHILIILLATFGLADKAFSDAGNCVKYDVDIQLNDGQILSGVIYGMGYQKKLDFQDISFLDYTNYINPSDTIHVYKNIQSLKFPTTGITTENCEFHFDATTSDNDIKIAKKIIKTITVVSYKVCNNCDVDYFWNGIYPTIITELTKREIDLLQNKPTAQLNFGHDIKYNTESYWFVSYSPLYDEDKLTAIMKTYLKTTNDLLTENKWDSVQVEYRKLKMELNKVNVIVFKIEYAL